MSSVDPDQQLSEALGRFRSAVQAYAALSEDSTECATPEEWLDLLAGMGEAVRAIHQAGASVSKKFGLASGQSRIGALLTHRLGESVSNYELAGAALVLEWARRIRELEKQEGWAIASGPDSGLSAGSYRLDVTRRNADGAQAWRLRHEIRRGPGSGGKKCLEYLRAVFPEAASKEDLFYVSQIQSWPRRVRELAETGWPIVSSGDDPTLIPGSYRLESLIQGPARARKAIKQRHQILERDDWTCRDCGASPRTERFVRLQIHHQVHVSQGGGNADENLVTLCAACHAGRHALDETQVVDELIYPGANPDLL